MTDATNTIRQAEKPIDLPSTAANAAAKDKLIARLEGRGFVTSSRQTGGGRWVVTLEGVDDSRPRYGTRSPVKVSGDYERQADAERHRRRLLACGWVAEVCEGSSLSMRTLEMGPTTYSVNVGGLV